MLLITLHEWLGPSSERIADANSKLSDLQHTNSLTTFATCLPLNAALERIMLYQQLFNQRYSKVKAVNFRLFTVCEVDGVSTALLDKFQTQMVECLPTMLEDFE